MIQLTPCVPKPEASLKLSSEKIVELRNAAKEFAECIDSGKFDKAGECIEQLSKEDRDFVFQSPDVIKACTKAITSNLNYNEIEKALEAKKSLEKLGIIVTDILNSYEVVLLCKGVQFACLNPNNVNIERSNEVGRALDELNPNFNDETFPSRSNSLLWEVE